MKAFQNTFQYGYTRILDGVASGQMAKNLKSLFGEGPGELNNLLTRHIDGLLTTDARHLECTRGYITAILEHGHEIWDKDGDK